MDPKSAYRFNYEYIPGVPMVDKLPSSERPSRDWYFEVIWQVLRNLRNRLNWIARMRQLSAAHDFAHAASGAAVPLPAESSELNLSHLGIDGIDRLDLAELPLSEPRAADAGVTKAASAGGISFGPALDALGEVGRIALGIMANGVRDPIKMLEILGQARRIPAAGRPQSLDDYTNLFTLLTPPWYVANNRFLDDEVFAWMRVAGPNPLVLERVAGPGPGFPVTEAHYQEAMADAADSLARAGAEGRLYLADYVDLAGADNGTFPFQKYSFSPKALFALPVGVGRRRLKPVAIQCGQDPERYCIFTPKDGEGWMKARFVVQSADGNHHELISHLGRTHLLIGAFALCLRRQMRDDHPIARLLLPHFEGTLNINEEARTGMLGAEGPVSKSLAASIQGSTVLAIAAFQKPHFNHAFLPDWLHARGLDDPDLDYPYREDALPIWNAIERWVTAYVRHTYADDTAVATDAQLQAWARETVADSGGRVPAFGEDGSGGIATVDYLIKALSMLIFTASAQHAVVNFGQGQLMTYAPAAPFASFRPAPRTKEEGRAGTWLDMVAPLGLAMFQTEFMNQLGGVYYSKLGEYKRSHFKDRGVEAALAAFQAELAAIQKEIEARNPSRFAPFTLLLPANIPQSIHI